MNAVVRLVPIPTQHSKGEQHQLKELKGVAAKDSKCEQLQLKELKGVAERIQKVGGIN